MDRFQSIDAFVRVAEASSFADVARQLGVSKSVITSRVQQLEGRGSHQRRHSIDVDLHVVDDHHHRAGQR